MLSRTLASAAIANLQDARAGASIICKRYMAQRTGQLLEAPYRCIGPAVRMASADRCRAHAVTACPGQAVYYHPAGQHDQCWQLAQIGTPSARSRRGQYWRALTTVSAAADHLQGITARQHGQVGHSQPGRPAQRLKEQHASPNYLSPHCWASQLGHGASERSASRIAVQQAS